MKTSNSTHLLIDTSFKDSLICVVRNNQVIYQLSTNQQRADNLLSLIAQIFGQELPAHFDSIIVRLGLGSYTGLRIGTTIACALSWSYRIPIVGVYSRRPRSLTVKELVRLARTKKPKLSSAWPVLIPKYTAWRSKPEFDKLKKQ